MCNASCIIFGVKNLNEEEVRGKRVIEVGAYDLNGSLRPVIEKFGPAEYIGVDIEAGPGGGRVCRAGDLALEIGADSFDIVISNELLEHIADWRSAISNLKKICRPGGIILITTRSSGFPFHAYPNDYWRYEPSDMEKIFSDCELVALTRDPEAPGVFLKVRKPADFIENNTDSISLYSIVSGRRMKTITAKDFYTFHYGRMIAKEKLKNILKFLFK